jgi:A/G-specific adenine glycosylase
MTEVPTGEWTPDFDEAEALNGAPALTRLSWRRVPGVVTHVFTHFPLELIVYSAEVPAKTAPPKGMRWIALDKVADEALPNVMRKVIAHALPSWPASPASFRVAPRVQRRRSAARSPGAARPE